MATMSNKEIAQKLGSLVQLDIDASHAYGQAIEKIDVPSIRTQIGEFRKDHERHITDLSSLIRDLGEKPPEYSRDFKGFLIQGMTALRSVTGIEGALKAMRTNEQLTNKTYAEAMTWSLPGDAKAMVDRNFKDEQRHLDYIEKTLQSRIWEQQKKY